LEGPILQRIRAFYRCAALVLHSDKCRATLPAELALELSRSSGDTLTLPLTTALATPMDAVTAFLTDPCRIIGEAHAAARSQQVAVSEIATTFTDSVKEWYEKVQRYSIDGAASDGQYHSELGVGATLINPLRRDSVTGA
jgi:hypothetical protein